MKAGEDKFLNSEIVLWSQLLNGNDQLAIQAEFHGPLKRGPQKNRRNSKFFLPLHLLIKVDQSIFFTMTYFA